MSQEQLALDVFEKMLAYSMGLWTPMASCCSPRLQYTLETASENHSVRFMFESCCQLVLLRLCLNTCRDSSPCDHAIEFFLANADVELQDL